MDYSFCCGQTGLAIPWIGDLNRDGTPGGRPLELESGERTLRIRVSPERGNDRDRLVTSLPVKFRIIGDGPHAD